jgi:hypothetical protein
VKVSADLSDVFFGHSTWDSFTAMTRIYKHYQLNLKQVCIPWAGGGGGEAHIPDRTTAGLRLGFWGQALLCWLGTSWHKSRSELQTRLQQPCICN